MVHSSESFFTPRMNFRHYQDFYFKDNTTKRFIDIITLNSRKIAGKIVLEIGAGPGVLSMTAAKCGAKHVYAWEPSPHHQLLREIIEENGLSSLITVLSCPIDSLDIKNVDTIISSCFGTGLFMNSYVRQFITARSYLNPFGSMLPKYGKIHLIGLTDSPLRKDPFWVTYDKFDLSPMVEEYNGETLSAKVTKEYVVTTDTILGNFNFEKMDNNFDGYRTSFTLFPLFKTTIFYFCFWFDLVFDTDYGGEHIGNGFSEEKPSWYHLIIRTEAGEEVDDTDSIKGEVHFRIGTHPRELVQVELSYNINGEERPKRVCYAETVTGLPW